MRSFKNRGITASIIFLCIFVLSSYAESADYAFVTFEFPPLEYTGDDGQPQGIAVVLVTQIMASLGHTVQINVYPWARALQMVRQGDADAIFTAYRTPERETFLDYSDEVLIPQIVGFYAKKDSPITFNGDLNTLHDLRIGVISTISYGPKFDQMRSQLQVDRVERLEQNFLKLSIDRIDLFISNIYVADWKLKKTRFRNEIVRLPQEVDRVSSFIAFSKEKNLRTLRDQFDQKLRHLKTSGKYENMIRKYGIELRP